MTLPLALVLVLLAAAMVMFAINKPRMDVVALLMIVALPFTGVLTVPETLTGFSDPTIVLIALLFVIGEGLTRTGVAQRCGDLLIARAGRSETRLMIFLMIVVAAVGSVMSSTGVVAIFIPVVLRVARNANIPAGRLMMPLSVAALISGMMTLVATPPNLVVQGELLRNGLRGFHFFAFLPFGAPVLVVAIVYMLLARRLLSRTASTVEAEPDRPRLARWIEEYSLSSRAYRLRIAADSDLQHQPLCVLDLRSSSGVNIVAIERQTRFGKQLVRPHAQTQLETGDVLIIDTFVPAADIDALCDRYRLEKLPLNGSYFGDLSQELGMAEVMIPATSALIDRTVIESRFRSQYDLTVIGLKHGRAPHAGNVLNERLQIGDTLLVVGPWRTIRKLRADFTNLIVLNLPAEMDDVVPAASRAPFAIASLLLVVILMVFGVVPNVQAALIGCLLMGLFGCIDMASAYRSIHWQSLVLIVGMIPFSLALQKTGGVDLAADGFMTIVGGASPRVVLAGVFVITALLGMFISNTATAILMAPVALAIARDLGHSPYPFAMTVALAASTAFMTPIASPINALVVGPGKYTFMDFVRVGVPLGVLVMLITVILVPWILPL